MATVSDHIAAFRQRNDASHVAFGQCMCDCDRSIVEKARTQPCMARGVMNRRAYVAKRGGDLAAGHQPGHVWCIVHPVDLLQRRRRHRVRQHEIEESTGEQTIVNRAYPFRTLMEAQIRVGSSTRGASRCSCRTVRSRTGRGRRTPAIARRNPADRRGTRGGRSRALIFPSGSQAPGPGAATEVA